jgi:hypothetical protein
LNKHSKKNKLSAMSVPSSTRSACLLNTQLVSSSVNNASNHTYTVDDVLSGFIKRNPNGSARTDTLPSAANLLNAFKGNLGSSGLLVTNTFLFMLSNESSVSTEEITLVAGTGGTLNNSIIVGADQVAQILIFVTSSSTVEFYALSISNSGTTSDISNITTSGDLTINADNVVVNADLQLDGQADISIAVIQDLTVDTTMVVNGNMEATNIEADNLLLGPTRTSLVPTATLHLQSTGTSSMWIEADTDNVTESERCRIIMTMDGNATQAIVALGDGVSSNDLTVQTYGGAISFQTGGTVSASADGVLPTITGAATERLNIGSTNITSTLPIVFPTSGGTASGLNYYEEKQTHTSNVEGIWAAAQASNPVLTRIGKTVTITMNGAAASANAAAAITLSTVLPTKWRPAVATDQVIRIIDNNTQGAGLAVFDTDGTVTIYPTVANTANFAGSNLSGFFTFTATWFVT